MKTIGIFLALTVIVIGTKSAHASIQEDFFALKREDVIERQLDQGAILLSSFGHELRLEREHIGRRLICTSLDDSKISFPEVSQKMFGKKESISVRCNNGTVQWRQIQ